MDYIRKALPFLKSRMEKEEEQNFLKNGSLVVQELLACFGGRYKLPIKSFATKELDRASKNFCEPVYHMSDSGYIYRGNFEGRPVLIKVYRGFSAMDQSVLNAAVHDIVITSQMSHLKNVLKLVGCSLEYEYPAMVYEYAGTDLLPKYLSHKNDGTLLISWRSRIKIASDIANVVAHLHTAFSTPIIYRDLTPDKVIIDHKCGVAKLFDFTLAIALPPGELQVEDPGKGSYRYFDPQYAISGYVTQKTDVYGVGMLMLVLFTGETETTKYDEGTGERIHVRDYTKHCLESNEINQLVDPNIFEEEGSNVLRQNLVAFLDLAFRCTEYEEIDRPEMTDVAKELFQIEKAVRCY